ncbi:MAG: transcriptional repressor [Bacteroidales bacterium]|nr:transcriptional repressor [Bacteroidales bacterium]
MNANDILHQHDLKKTLSRVALINALQNSNIPLSETEIKERMRDQYDRITFYRNVQALSESGILHRIVIDNTMVKYALNCCEQEHRHSADHVHFFCKECGKTICLEQLPVQHYPLPDGFTASECDVVIKGLCQSCSGFLHA